MHIRRYQNGVCGELGFWCWGAGAAGGTGDALMMIALVMFLGYSWKECEHRSTNDDRNSNGD